MPKKEKVKEMFGQIAPKYDNLNHIMSFSIDKSWRRKAIKRLSEGLAQNPQPEVLDLACGTGDFAIQTALSIPFCHVTGVDLTEEMLRVMEEKVVKEGLSGRIAMEVGDGENLRFPDGSFERVSCAFGIRNFEDREKGLREMLRVLKPGGRVVILELSEPGNPVVRWLYNLYFLHILPLIGGKVSGDKAAYRYLPASVVKFPPVKVFMQTMRDCGFGAVSQKAFTFGTCRMYIGEKLS